MWRCIQAFHRIIIGETLLVRCTFVICAIKVSGSEVNAFRVSMPKVREANVDTSKLWSYPPTNGFEHYKLELACNYKSRPKNLESLRLELRKMLI